MIIPDSSILTDSIVYSFDIKTQTWSTSSMMGMIPSRHKELQPVSNQNGKIYSGSDIIDYTATLLPNGNIIYIRDFQSNLNVIHFDNVNMKEFSKKFMIVMIITSTMATEATITLRIGHTAVLNKKGEIIIYGGVYSTSLVSYDPSIAY
ncbi:hypothetical protein C1645_816440 [Glomus cerebriforme]|uniref:Bulb-type lectin domain-containing protein n=1 Tax=Glomus cerebriforme TaxID=658196 RepID=A0A397TBK9_9GLOM|nr:hypothetical protein C1645_816440 [Glomus cerebriforme]